MRAAAGLACAGLRRHVAKQLYSVLNALETDLCTAKNKLCCHLTCLLVSYSPSRCKLVLFLWNFPKCRRTACISPFGELDLLKQAKCPGKGRQLFSAESSHLYKRA